MGEKGGADDLKCWFDAFCSMPHRSICEKAGVRGKFKKVCDWNSHMKHQDEVMQLLK